MAQLASKVSQEVPTLGHFLVTWGIPLRVFRNFYQVFVNICAFFLRIHGKPTKVKHLVPKVMSIAQKHRKSA